MIDRIWHLKAAPQWSSHASASVGTDHTNITRLRSAVDIPLNYSQQTQNQRVMFKQSWKTAMTVCQYRC